MNDDIWDDVEDSSYEKIQREREWNRLNNTYMVVSFLISFIFIYLFTLLLFYLIHIRGFFGLTLNLLPDSAADLMRSTSALAMRFFTGP